MSILNDKANQSRTAKLWTDNLIKPVFLMMIFVRAEREADWPLHLWAVERCFHTSLLLVTAIMPGSIVN